MTLMRTYSELIKLPTFEERFDYLKLNGKVCEETFGFDRYLNQKFYNSKEWRRFRNGIITRDLGCDLGIADREIVGTIFIHHMNPIEIANLVNLDLDLIMNPEYVICSSHNTHNAIHYGSKELLYSGPVERQPYDTCPWRKG